jgi:hypothetical protein
MCSDTRRGKQDALNCSSGRCELLGRCIDDVDETLPGIVNSQSASSVSSISEELSGRTVVAWLKKQPKASSRGLAALVNTRCRPFASLSQAK